MINWVYVVTQIDPSLSCVASEGRQRLSVWWQILSSLLYLDSIECSFRWSYATRYLRCHKNHSAVSDSLQAGWLSFWCTIFAWSKSVRSTKPSLRHDLCKSQGPFHLSYQMRLRVELVTDKKVFRIALSWFTADTSWSRICLILPRSATNSVQIRDMLDY